MQKFLRTLMLAALMLPFASQAQTMYLTVADGTTTNSYVPVYGLYVDDFVRCQTVYPASMLSGMTGEAVLGLTYYLSTPATASWGVANFVVNVMEVQDTTLSAFVDMTNATTVYTGSLDATQSTMEISFTVPYTYQGGNLLIEIYNTLEGTYKSAYFYGVAATGASWQGNNGTSVANITGAARDFMPKTTFTYGQPPTCFKVTNLAIDNTQTTPNSLTLTWTDALNTGATYTVYDMADTSVVATGVTGTTYTVTGLNANTSYSYAVMTDCGGGDVTGLTAPVSGRTACAAMDLPWTCGFEANEIQSTTQATALPWCSYRYVSAATSGTTYPYSYSGNAHGGSRSLYFYGTTGAAYPDTMTFILPQVDVTVYPMNANRLTFWARSSSTSYDKVVYVGTLTDPTDPTTYTFVDYVTVTGTTHTKYSIPLTTASATAPYVCVTVLKGSGSLYIDDMTLEEMPSCLEVTGLTASDITSSSVTLNWADASNPAGTTYSVYDMSDTTLLGTAATTTYTVSGLNPDFQYTFGVQANCSAGDAPYTTVSARTACAVVTMPWSEDFDDWTSKSPCWSFLSGAYNGGAGTPTANTSAWTLNSTYGNYITISGKALTMNLYSTNKYWAVTPLIEITDDALFTVDLAASAWSAAAPNYDDNDTLAVAISTDGGTTFTTLQVLTQNDLNALTGTYTTIYIPVTGHTGDTVRFAIYGGSTSGTSPYDNRMVIDNFSVVANTGDICYPVTGLTVSNITENGATLTWVGTANSYNVYTISGTDTTLYQNVTDTAIILTGLTAMTNYTYGVTAVCSSDESTMATVTFSTACDAVTLPYVESFEATSATRNCWNLVSNNTENVGGTNGMGYVDNTLRFSSYSSATDYNQYGFSPELNVSSAATGLNVKVRYATYGSGDQLTFGYITATDTVWETTSHTTNGQSDMQYFEAIIPATATQLAVHYYGSYAYYAWIDSVWVNEITADYCYPVSGLTVDSVTATSVTLSWSDTDNGGATYTIYGANGSVIATDIAATTYEITGLTASTNYTFGVTADCSATESSNVVTISARTDCAGGSCLINVFALDSYGDGWNGAILEVKQGGVIIATYSMAGQGVYSTTIYDTFTVAVCADQRVEFEWFAGSYDDEISFMIADHNGDSLYYAADASEIVGFTFFMVDNPCGVNVADSATVFTTVTIPQHGSVTPDGMISYALGETVTVTATPDSGYVFTYWTIANAADTNNLFGDTVYANPYTFTIDSTMVNSIIILKASFESVSGIEDSMTVFLANNNQAMGTINPAAGEYHVADGDSLVISAVANPGYHFLYWTREVQYFPASITSVDTIYSATHTVHGMTWLLESVHNYTAYFEVDTTAAPNYYTLTVICDTTMGTVTGVPTTAVAEGTLVTLTAIPNPGYHFVDWSTGETTPTINVTVNSDMTLVANFAADAQTYTVQVLWDETMGNVTGVPEGPVVAGSSVTLMANALTGYRFVAWLMDDDTLSHNHIYTIQSVDDNMTLIAVFAEGVGIDDVDMSNVKIYSSENTIHVNGAEGQQLFLFDVNGRILNQIDKAGENVEFRVANTGVYMVKVGNAAAKRVVVVR
ncbi:MAG: fibronectin type III domain-containing protein [Bacteroidales bacterium]|nr:fibronectin type III domain-containing protein [Bacteroidales bacterium]